MVLLVFLVFRDTRPTADIQVRAERQDSRVFPGFLDSPVTQAFRDSVDTLVSPASADTQVFQATQVTAEFQAVADSAAETYRRQHAT